MCWWCSAAPPPVAASLPLYIKHACGRVRACKQARPSDQAGNHRQTFSSCRLHHRNTTGLHRITQAHPSNLVHNYGLQRIPQENQGIPRVSYIISHYLRHYNQRTSVYFFKNQQLVLKLFTKISQQWERFCPSCVSFSNFICFVGNPLGILVISSSFQWSTNNNLLSLIWND